MKNYKTKNIKPGIFGIILTICLLISSCDVLDKEPLNSLHQEQVWENIGFVQMYLNDLYKDFLPEFPFADSKVMSEEGLSDETQFLSSNDDNLKGLANSLIYGSLLKDGFSYLNREFYSNIAKINRLLTDIQTSSIDESEKEIIVAQALFLRAWAYWGQVKLHGGIPMVMEKLEPVVDGELQLDDLFPARNKTSECIELIIQDLDDAYENLPSEWDSDDDYGRITRGAALALKGRILLFWASPQFNPDNKSDRWQRAYEANKEALDILEQDGFGLHPSFTDLFHTCNEINSEAIFVRVYDESNFYHSYDAKVRPSLAGVSGGGTTNNPTWEMVKAFPMADGFPISDTSGSFVYDTALFWQNRDPRFEYTIAYNSGTWPLSGISDYKIWTYYTLSDDKKTYSISKQDNHYSTTGFFCKKYVNPGRQIDDLSIVGTDWMEIRFAEVLLNFAECANEIGGKSSEVREALNRIRNERTDVKAGMDYIDKHIGNQEILREIIMTERQIEMAFENKRYFDVRRRNMFSEDLGPNIKKLNNTTRSEYRIYLNEVSASAAAEMLLVRDELDFSNIRQYNNSFGQRFTYNLDAISPINYPQPKFNFLPIDKENVEKNLNIKRNIYWEGSFDPLAE